MSVRPSLQFAPGRFLWSARFARLRAWPARRLLATCLLLFAAAAGAQDDPPGRVGRVADLQGGVFWYDSESDRWTEGERNRPLTAGDRVSTADDGRLELGIGSTTLRLGGSSELEVVQLDDEHIGLQLHAGQLALRVRSGEVAREIELATPEARLLPQRAGHYRVERLDEASFAGVWSGELRVDDAQQAFAIVAGQRVRLARHARSGELEVVRALLEDDAFGQWALAADRRDDERGVARARPVSPEMTGAEDLDAYGRWEQHAEYGSVWYPIGVAAGWAPYRYGRWAWVRPWGWTWIDDARWGFAPFHYGRWVFWGGRWGWAPGAWVARPVWAPALVAWVGGPSWSVGVHVGGPAVGWVPLAPREHYVPWYRHTPAYAGRVNIAPPPRPGRPRDPLPAPQQRAPGLPTLYTNAGVPGGVTVVARDVLVGRQPVGRAVVDLPPERRAHIQPGEAPARPWPAPGSRERGPGQGLPRPPRESAPQTTWPRGGGVPAWPDTRPPAPLSAQPGPQIVPGGTLPRPPAVSPRGRPAFGGEAAPASPGAVPPGRVFGPGQPRQGAPGTQASSDRRPEHRPEHRPEQRPEHRPEHRPEQRPEHRPGHPPEGRPGFSTEPRGRAGPPPIGMGTPAAVMPAAPIVPAAPAARAMPPVQAAPAAPPPARPAARPAAPAPAQAVPSWTAPAAAPAPTPTTAPSDDGRKRIPEPRHRDRQANR